MEAGRSLLRVCGDLPPTIVLNDLRDRSAPRARRYTERFDCQNRPMGLLRVRGDLPSSTGAVCAAGKSAPRSRRFTDDSERSPEGARVCSAAAEIYQEWGARVVTGLFILRDLLDSSSREPLKRSPVRGRVALQETPLPQDYLMNQPSFFWQPET